MSLTDSAGRYSIPVNFNTYSGPSALRGDSCNGVLKRVSVSAYTDSQRSWPLILDIDSKSHPAWTGGTQQLLDRGGRVSRFQKKFSGFLKKD